MEHGHVRAYARREETDDIRFLDWYLQSRFHLMERFLEDFEHPTTPVVVLKRRFLRAIRHAKRVLAARGVVTVLLALGVLATAAAGVAEAVWVPDPFEPGVAATSTLLARLAAVAGSASLLLLLSRLALDRYLELIDTCATFLGMQLAASTTRPSPQR